MMMVEKMKSQLGEEPRKVKLRWIWKRMTWEEKEEEEEERSAKEE